MEGDDCVFCLQPLLLHPDLILNTGDSALMTTIPNNSDGHAAKEDTTATTAATRSERESLFLLSPPPQPPPPLPHFGSAHPCGHCFHVACFESWRKHEVHRNSSLWKRLGLDFLLTNRNSQSHNGNNDSSVELPCPICRTPTRSFERIYLNFKSSDPPSAAAVATSSSNGNGHNDNENHVDGEDGYNGTERQSQLRHEDWRTGGEAVTSNSNILSASLPPPPPPFRYSVPVAESGLRTWMGLVAAGVIAGSVGMGLVLTGMVVLGHVTTNNNLTSATTSATAANSDNRQCSNRKDDSNHDEDNTEDDDDDNNNEKSDSNGINHSANNDNAAITTATTTGSHHSNND